MYDLVNTQQAQAWNGYEGTHWARNQDRWDAVNGGFDEPLLAAAGITEQDRVLDIGCGAGSTTRLAAQRASAGSAMGLDLSAPMLERARESALRADISNVSFEQGDAQVRALQPESFDVAISRFGVMFFADPVAAFVNIKKSLRPGGRIAFVCAANAEGNEWLQAVAALRDFLPVGGFGDSEGPGMFSLADPERIRDVLTAAGFDRIAVESAEARGNWGSDAEDAADFLLGSGPGRHLMDQADGESRARARAALTGILRSYEEGGAVRLRSTAWLVVAERPA
ncbi:methyltransferase domain-containing protein [Streptomyces sp. NPDC050738]|uniref:class I SAM-dependent methyltransferase n=1 Tax=Streptomyces sp. NPDC050738 TaxID=3154744 RepID=UPI00342F1BCA